MPDGPSIPNDNTIVSHSSSRSPEAVKPQTALETNAPPEFIEKLKAEVKRHLSSAEAVSLQRMHGSNDTAPVTELTQGIRFIVVDDDKTNLSIAIALAKGDPIFERLYPMYHHPNSLGESAEDLSITAFYRGDRFGRFQIPGNRNAYLERFIFTNNPTEEKNYNQFVMQKWTADSKAAFAWDKLGHAYNAILEFPGQHPLPLGNADYETILEALQNAKPNVSTTRLKAKEEVRSLGYKEVKQERKDVIPPTLPSGQK